VEYLYNLLDFYLSIFNIPFACRHKIDIWPGANPSSAACASISTLRQRPRHFRLVQQWAPLQSRLSNRPPEIPEIPIIILRHPITFQPAVHPIDARKSPAERAQRAETLRPPLAARCRRRFGAQWLGANRRILPAQLFIGKLSAIFVSHFWGPLQVQSTLHLKTGSGKCGNCRWAGKAFFPPSPFSLRPHVCVRA
jgi:hypothetical protein